MAITVEEVFETAAMTLYQHLDIRTSTLGLNLMDCIHSDFAKFRKRVYERVYEHGRDLIAGAHNLETKYGIPVVNKRIAITPVSLIMETHATRSKFVAMAQTLDRAATDAKIDFIGGFGALCHKGLTASDAVLIESLADVLSKTKRVCSY